jgi:hypothetical protein
MDTNQNNIVYVVAYRDAQDTENASEAWQDGDFEPYNWYESSIEALEVLQALKDSLKAENRKDVKVFVHGARREWCERNLA